MNLVMNNALIAPKKHSFKDRIDCKTNKNSHIKRGRLSKRAEESKGI